MQAVAELSAVQLFGSGFEENFVSFSIFCPDSDWVLPSNCSVFIRLISHRVWLALSDDGGGGGDDDEDDDGHWLIYNLFVTQVWLV